MNRCLAIIPFLVVLALPVQAMSIAVLRDRPTLSIPTYHVVDNWFGGRIDLPSMVFLIDHPQGLTLIDAGCGSRFDEVTGRFPLNLLYSYLQVGKSPIVRDRLLEMGISPKAIKRIVLTHLHFDHVGGVVDFPDAEIIVNKREWASSRLPDLFKDSIAKRLKLVDFSRATAYEGFERSLDLYGDGRLVLVETPGHTKGHMAAFVNLPSGKRYFLAGDIAWIEDNYLRPVRKGWPMRWLMEPDWNDDALLRMHALAKRSPEIRIVPFHDPKSNLTLPVIPARCE